MIKGRGTTKMTRVGKLVLSRGSIASDPQAFIKAPRSVPYLPPRRVDKKKTLIDFTQSRDAARLPRGQERELAASAEHV